MKSTKDQMDAAKNELRAMLPPDSTVYTIVTSISVSGTSRHIKAFAVSHNQIVDITSTISTLLLGKYYKETQTLRIEQHGHDLVYELSKLLYADGYGSRCPFCGRTPFSATSATMNSTGIICKHPTAWNPQGENALIHKEL